VRTYVHDNYGISGYRYRELFAFCRQYAEWKLALSQCYSLQGPVPHAARSGGVNDPTSAAAMRAEQYQKNIALVERTVQEAAPEIANALLKAVTDGMPYEWLDVPMGRRQFYDARRKFFYLLDKAKG
jgi:lysophospholipase L1-like esterase